MQKNATNANNAKKCKESVFFTLSLHIPQYQLNLSAQTTRTATVGEQNQPYISKNYDSKFF